MLIRHYTQSAILTNVNAHSTTWYEILSRQPINDNNQQLLFSMIAQFALR